MTTQSRSGLPWLYLRLLLSQLHLFFDSEHSLLKAICWIAAHNHGCWGCRTNEKGSKPPSFYVVTNAIKERPDVWIDQPEKWVSSSILSSRTFHWLSSGNFSCDCWWGTISLFLIIFKFYILCGAHEFYLSVLSSDPSYFKSQVISVRYALRFACLDYFVSF